MIEEGEKADKPLPYLFKLSRVDYATAPPPASHPAVQQK